MTECIQSQCYSTWQEIERLGSWFEHNNTPEKKKEKRIRSVCCDKFEKAQGLLFLWPRIKKKKEKRVEYTESFALLRLRVSRVAVWRKFPHDHTRERCTALHCTALGEWATHAFWYAPSISGVFFLLISYFFSSSSSSWWTLLSFLLRVRNSIHVGAYLIITGQLFLFPPPVLSLICT